MFNHRYIEEVYQEYGRWLLYITDLFLPCCNTETGDLLSLPFPGSASEQPFMSFQIIKLVQGEYKTFIAEQRKKEMAAMKAQNRHRPRRV